MSSVYMLRQNVYFDKQQPSDDVLKSNINVLTSTANFLFPSNVIDCTMMITKLNFVQYKVANAGIANYFVSNIGAGVDNISCASTQVDFTAWMKLLNIQLGTNPQNVWSNINTTLSYLTVTIIAQCE